MDARQEHVAASGARSLGQRLQEARARAFVGRDAELAGFSSALRGDPGSPSVIYVYGPGGIGKSYLLRQWAQQARQAGRTLVELDGRFVGRNPADFEKAAGSLLSDSGSVLLVDTFEQCQWLEAWLRDRFLPRISDGALVVVSGRKAPAAEWAVDPGWVGMLRVLELGPLTTEQSRDLLIASGVDSVRHGPVIQFAGGYPLALSLAAAVTSVRPGAAATWKPSAEVVRTLLAGLVGEVTSASHRRALEVAAQAHSTSEELLQAVLPDEDAHALFDWLCGLPFMETAAQGVYPHDAAREALAADLRWRAPNAFVTMQRRLRDEYLRLLRGAPDEQVLFALGQIFFLFRDVKALADIYTWSRRGQVHDDPLRPEDVDTLLQLAAEAEGEKSAELVRYWIKRQPKAFSVYRLMDTGRTVAFSARIVLPAPPDEEDVATDPVVATAWSFVERSAPVRPGEHIALTRFAIYPEAYQAPSPVLNLDHWRSLAEAYRGESRGRAHGILVYHDAETWRGRLAAIMTEVDEEVRVGDRSYTLFANDWRQVPFETWLDHVTSATVVPSGPTPGQPGDFQDPNRAPTPTRETFNAAVREALQNWRNPRMFEATSLLESRLVAGADDPAADALRAVIQEVIDKLGTESRGVKAYDVVVATYLEGAPTQEVAARRLGLPFGTYRRHLRTGLERVCDMLWEIELYGKPDG
ncbi:AAA family ATPase [Streptomyces sp. NPDC098781]|uniref:AAA family ATPase n=1 Tax=Streptomyces sp. NPDC098781 TaxID=3366097 RepID=UPI00381DD9EF